MHSVDHRSGEAFLNVIHPVTAVKSYMKLKKKKKNKKGSKFHYTMTIKRGSYFTVSSVKLGGLILLSRVIKYA